MYTDIVIKIRIQGTEILPSPSAFVDRDVFVFMADALRSLPYLAMP